MTDGLNPEQKRAVETTEGPLLVLAGAGSGKTRVLTHRIAYLVGGCGIAPEAVLAVTFTNKAAGEMRERVEKLLGSHAEGLWVTTFHSACVRILRRDIGHLGISRGFVIYDDADTLGTIKEALRRHGLDPKAHDPRRIRWRIDEWKNAGLMPADAAGATRDLDEEQIAEIYSSYQRLLTDANALDFNDLLLHTVRLFEEYPEVLAYYRRRWQYLLVDEYQDTNRVQYRLLRLLAAEHHNICVVGDADQSVYGWRGADIRNILDFEEDYPSAEVVKLEQNYRSTQPILEGASAVVENNAARRERRLWTEREGGEKILLYEAHDDRDEAMFTVSQILGAVRKGDRQYRDFAIFYRTNAQSRVFEDELLKYDVPYVIVGGVRFYERAEIKDALAYLRVLLNPTDDMGLRRIVNVPARGIGKTSVERAAEVAVREGVPLLEGFRLLVERGEAGRSAKKIADFLRLIAQLSEEVRSLAPADALARILDRTGYLRALERDGTPEAETRIENLRELLSGAEDFEAQNAEDDDERGLLALFLDQVALVSDLDSYEDEFDRVSLMTVHSAKGLEFPAVFLVGLEEGVFPHSISARDPDGIEEERRLCYVGMTRAMEKLTISFARERRRFGSTNFGVPSRFLREIPPQVLEGDPPDGSGFEDGPRVDYSYSQEDAGEGTLQPGLRVRHPVFGAGTVVKVRGEGAAAKLDIRFDRAGVKTVMLKFANLELG
ncbi:MAG: UvrD-helicase domain-containing protein [Myxococcales bacterium]|nr:UvrD-helicase domain-containing protein [Myxococcales bacterium]